MSSRAAPAIETMPLGIGIPKIIHQTFASRDLPEVFGTNVRAIQEMNPGWKHVLYDDADVEHFIRENYGEQILARHARIDRRYGAARADLFRYLLMYRVGGVYLDIKSTTIRPLDETLRPDDCYIVSHWANRPGEAREGWGLHEELKATGRGEYQQWHVICAPGHPFLKAVIENVLRNIDRYSPWRYGLGRPAVLRVSGPIVYTKAIQPIRHLHPHRLVENEGEVGLEYSVLPCITHSKLFPIHYVDVERPMIAASGLGWCGAQLYLGARWVRNKGRDWLEARKPRHA
jgi:mannosyltransferase OCH1-like enzyme